ncbi:MAG: protease modulator HflC [Planctomycetota bacterium]
MNTLARTAIVVVAVLIVSVVTFNSCTVAVDQKEFVVVSFLGEIKSVIDEPGLALRIPFSSVTSVSRQVQEYANDEPSATVTGDKKNILISYFSRYRVDDPVTYLQARGGSIRGAGRLGDILYSELKTEVSKHSLEDIVNAREGVSQAILDRAGPKVKQYGVKLIDFRIKRTDLPEDVIGSVYSRMKAERDQMAQTYRSEGEKEKLTLEANANRREREILSEAYRKKQEIIGLADAEALKIVADAYAADLEFALFLRTLDVYRASLQKGSRLVLSTDSELMRYLESSAK